jgi:hypothetical protein
MHLHDTRLTCSLDPHCGQGGRSFSSASIFSPSRNLGDPRTGDVLVDL